ncbi:MAG: KH domain-containing protein [Chloroflexi bacterium]|nr:KH domain-containing protein [Chloroflexota bacterium]
MPGAPDDPPLAPGADAEDEIDFAGSTLRELLTLLGLQDTQIEAREPETPGDGVGRTAQVFEISGETEDASDELGLLIGRRGETLGALQYLLNVITRQRYGEANHVFAVDVEGYKRRRERSLVEMARRVAAEVRDTGDVITLEPMKPAERRIVHLALSEEPGVVTESVGSGNDRQVEVLPADFEEYDEGYEDDYDDYDESTNRDDAGEPGDEPMDEPADEHYEDGEGDEQYDEDEDDGDDEEPNR